MGIRALILVLKNVALAIAAAWIIVLPHLRIRPQLSQQDQQLQQQRRQIQQLMQQANMGGQENWTTSAFDLGQNIRLSQIDDHLKSTDSNIDKVREQNNLLGRELSDVEGRESVWFSIIGALVIGSIGLSGAQLWKSSKGQP